MIHLNTPNGLKASVPENRNEDDTPRFDINLNIEGALNYYKKQGYVIFSKCVSEEACNELRNLWDNEIKPHKGKIYRQTTAKAEKNLFNENNWIMNPILNLQSLNSNLFGNLKKSVEREVFSNPSICDALKLILGEKPKIVQSMYFEGNSATWEHQDTYYLDSENIGAMTAGWLALEEIKADAGRFFICPESHKINLPKQSMKNNYASNHDFYINEIVSIIKLRNMNIKAPHMNSGDILFWNSRTVHGSLDSQSKINSRSSITLHAIPETHRLMQFQSRLRDLETDDLKNSLIHRPKDQSKFINRLIFAIESNFPSVFYWIKKQAIKSLFKKN